VAVGGRLATFAVHSTNTPASSVPNPFAFTAVAGVAPSTTVVSNTITIGGIQGYSTATISNGQFSIGCNGTFFVSYSTVTNGMQICVRHTSSASFSTDTSTVLSVGGVAATFTSTTVAADTTPDAFTFAAQSNVTQSTMITSLPITVAGINSAAPVTVVGGEYGIGCTNYTTAAGTVTSGQTICVRHMSASQASTTVNTTLAVGGVSSTFSSMTTATSGGGTSGGGGSLDPVSLIAFGSFLLWIWRRARGRKCA
jgi:hypothetical protein